MKPLSYLVVAIAVAFAWFAKAEPATQPAKSVLDFTMNRIDGSSQPLSAYAGKVLLIVNTASKCGFTKQYAGLEQLHEKYSERGLAVLGFPCNDFGKQEPGTDAEITEFCTGKYNVKFDMFSKIAVKNDAQCTLYKFLTSPETNPASPGEVKWNFEKFLISRDGKILARFRSKVEPGSDEMTKAIEAALGN